MLTSFPIIDAVIEGLQDGKIFRPRDDAEFILHKSGFSYLSANGNKDAEELMAFFIGAGSLPVYYHIYDARPFLISGFQGHGDRFNLKIRERVQLQFRGKERVAVEPASRDYTVRRIGQDDFELLSEFGLHIESKFWRSKRDFLANGYGFCVFNRDNRPSSVCYSASIAGRTAEIDVATLLEHRNQGLARKAVGAFVNCSIENGITPNWDCFVDNEASLKTATGLGFVQQKTYTFLSVYNKSLEK